MIWAGIDTIAFIITVFITVCASLYLWITRRRGLVASEQLGCGALVAIGNDGLVYNAMHNPLGICMVSPGDGVDG